MVYCHTIVHFIKTFEPFLLSHTPFFYKWDVTAQSRKIIAFFGEVAIHNFLLVFIKSLYAFGRQLVGGVLLYVFLT